MTLYPSLLPLALSTVLFAGCGKKSTVGVSTKEAPPSVALPSKTEAEKPTKASLFLDDLLENLVRSGKVNARQKESLRKNVLSSLGRAIDKASQTRSDAARLHSDIASALFVELGKQKLFSSLSERLKLLVSTVKDDKGSATARGNTLGSVASGLLLASPAGPGRSASEVSALFSPALLDELKALQKNSSDPTEFRQGAFGLLSSFSFSLTSALTIQDGQTGFLAGTSSAGDVLEGILKEIAGSSSLSSLKLSATLLTRALSSGVASSLAETASTAPQALEAVKSLSDHFVSGLASSSLPPEEKESAIAALPSTLSALASSAVLASSSDASASDFLPVLSSSVVSSAQRAGVEGVNPVGVSALVCSSDGEVGCQTTEEWRATNTMGLANKVLSGQTVAGTVGNVTLPAPADVKSGVLYGVAGAGLTGAYAGVAVANCTADGNVNCKIPATGPLKAADTTHFTGWDIRKKRSDNGTVLSFAGLTSQSKSHCRNRANRSVFNNTTAPAATAGVGDGSPDFFDTIDDNNDLVSGLPGEIPAWTMVVGGNTVMGGSDFACGGIYATGDRASNNTGADATLAHDADGNWQDLTPGVLPGATNSANTTLGCNAGDKHCVFKELMSGLLVTEVSASAYSWDDAISYCDKLGEGTGAVTSPIPVIGGATYADWRLPTQKELYGKSHHGCLVVETP